MGPMGPMQKPQNWIERGFNWIGDLHMVTDNFSRFAGLLNANAEAPLSSSLSFQINRFE